MRQFEKEVRKKTEEKKVKLNIICYSMIRNKKQKKKKECVSEGDITIYDMITEIKKISHDLHCNDFSSGFASFAVRKRKKELAVIRPLSSSASA